MPLQSRVGESPGVFTLPGNLLAWVRPSIIPLFFSDHQSSRDLFLSFLQNQKLSTRLLTQNIPNPTLRSFQWINTLTNKEKQKYGRSECNPWSPFTFGEGGGVSHTEEDGVLRLDRGVSGGRKDFLRGSR